ncbi:MAG: translocation/assembly module TamB domain-containing protein [Planctomycetota bacterium]|nr:translocation/assembly module TamB domain-containing protein [Planctomycetota bacterium]
MNHTDTGETRPKRGRRLAVRAALLVVLVLVGAWFARARIVSEVLRRTASSAGIAVDWRDLAIDGLESVRISNLTVRRDADLNVEADLALVEFSLLRILRGDLGGLKRVRVDRLRGFAGPFERAGPGSGKATSFTLPSALPRVELTSPDFEVRLAQGRRVALSDLALVFDGAHATIDARTLAWVDSESSVAFPLTVRGSYRGSHFEIERAAWDPRIVFENARVDVGEAESILLRFEGGMRAFGGTAELRGRVDVDVLHCTAVVKSLDAGAALRSYVPSLAADAEGVVDFILDASVPLTDVKRAEWNVRVAAHDARFHRSVDEVSFRARTIPNGIEVSEGLVVHGENAIRFSARGASLTSDPCTWIEAAELHVDAIIGDVHALLMRDVGLALQSEARWNATPVAVTATLVGGRVAGHVRSPSTDVAAIVSAFAGTSPLTAHVDVDADVQLDVRAPAFVSAAGVIVAAGVNFAGRTVETLVAHVDFGPHTLEIRDLSATASGSNRVDAAFARVPRAALGRCALDHLAEWIVIDLVAELDDVPALLRLDGEENLFQRWNAHRLAFAGDLASAEVHLTRGELVTAAGSAEIARARIPLGSNIAAILSDPGLDVELSLRFEDVAAAVAVLAPDAFAVDEMPRGAVTGRARVRGNAIRPSVALDLTARDLTVQNVLFDSATVRAELDESELSIAAAAAHGTVGTLTLSGGYVFDEQRVVDAHLHADLVDVSRLSPERLPSGAVKADITANGLLDALVGTIALEARDVVWRDFRVDLFEIHARSTAGAWTVDRAHVVGQGVEAELSGRVSSLAPDALLRTIVVETLTLATGDMSAAITAPATLRQDGERWSLDGLRLEGVGGNAQLSFENSDGASKFDLALSAPLPRAALTLAGIAAEEAQVEATVHAVLRGRELDCDTEGRITTTAGPDEPETRAVWRASLHERRARIDQVTLDRGSGASAIHAKVTGEFPLDPFGDELLADGPLALHFELAAADVALLPFVRREYGASGTVRVASDLAGTWAGLTGSIDAQVLDASASGLRWIQDLGRVSGSMRLALADVVRLDSLDFVVDDVVEIRAAGSIETPLDLTRIARGDFERVASAPIDLALIVDAADLAPLAKRMPTLRRTRGRVHAELRAEGTLREPTFTGSGTLEEGEIRTTTNLPSIVGVSSRVHFDGKHLIVDDLTGEMGGAPFTMKGQVSVVGEVPEVDLELAGASLLLWRERDVTVRADAELSLKGPLDALLLSGDLALRDGRYTKKFDFLSVGKRGPKSAGNRGLRLFALDEPPFSTMRFDVNVSSAMPFAISSNILRGSVSPSLRLLGTGALPELRGTVLVEPSRVLLPSGALKVRSGRIEFRPDRPDVPDLDIQASARLQGYDIEVNVSGSYDDPRVELSSVPPLPREDLAILLITGRPPGNTLSGGAGQRAAFDIAVYIARDVAATWFESDESEVESLAERLEVVVGADTSKSGADAVLVRLRLFGDLTSGRSAIFATGERDVYDFYNFGLRFVFTFE